MDLRRSVGIAGICFTTIVACAHVVGLDDYTVHDDGTAEGGTTTTTDAANADGVVSGGDAFSSGDSRSDAPDSCALWHPHFFEPCAIPAPSPAIVLPPAATLTYDTNIPGFVEDPPTDPPAMTIDQGGTPAVLISVDGFTVPQGTTLRVVGGKPLIIASWTTVDIRGTIDVGSSLTSNRSGAGANPKICDATRAGAGADEIDTGLGSGGGGGGGFGGNGGKGGPGDTGAQNPGGDGGGQIVNAPLIVRGGCSGAASGKAGPDPQVTAPSNANTTAPGGTAGGGIQLSARQSITVGGTGRVLAGGAGGGGSPLNAAVGGGGGGSGGYIGFDAPTYTFTANARLAANGGGGGSSNALVSTGQPGSDGRDDTTAASGGAAGSCAVVGAQGGAGVMLNGSSASQASVSCGGAGGGGGVGYIVVFAASFAVPSLVSFSPLPTIVN